MRQEETFGDILNRIIPGHISLAKLTREADVDYSYVHTAKKGSRDGKDISPSVQIVQKLLEALRRMGVEVSKDDEVSLYNISTTIPEGYKLVAEDSEPPENWEEWPQELKEAMGYTQTLSPESQKFVYRLWREQAKAHAEIENQLRMKKAELEKISTKPTDQ